MRRPLSIVLSLLILVLAGGCGMTTGDSPAVTQPTATTAPTSIPTLGPPTPTNVPANWQVYSGTHFTIAYPPAWTMAVSAPQTSLMGGGIVLSDPAAAPATGQIIVNEAWGYSQSQLQAMCQLQGTTATLAGLPVKYSVGEGVHRNWLFINSHGISYTLDAMDANQPQSVQQQHDSILATFRPDDTATGCA